MISSEMDQAGQEATPLLPVVGIGASAGGLEAVSRLLEKVPPDTGMAFVVVQHLDPSHPTMLAELLGKRTTLPVRQVEDGVQVEASQVYVIPPNSDMVLREGALRLTPRTTPHGLHMPIDRLFRSLAEERGSVAIGVVLSGTGSDGALGIKDIKAGGGITLAQDASAQHDGMPRSAIGTGAVDFVLPPEEIARELVWISRHPYIVAAARPSPAPGPAGDHFGALIKLLRRATGVDFSGYKAGTLVRRVHRRLALHRLENLEDYLRLLEGDTAEVEALCQDILIRVTSFFRDPEVFEALGKTVFPALVRERGHESPVRIWVPGCASGEEAYSLAICLLEYLGDRAGHTPIKLFATDVSELAIRRAREGRYVENIALDVSAERLRRFFIEVEGGFQVSKAVRDLCVFARHDLTRDPPFSDIDLISCRNVLIYFGPPLQKRVLPIFHYALAAGGHLLLGSSESIGDFTDLFQTVDGTHKIYQRRPAPMRPSWDFTRSEPDRGEGGPVRPSHQLLNTLEIQREADRLVLLRYGPPGVVVSENMEILHFRGHTGRYLEPAPGAASLSLLRMAREGLAPGLRAALDEVKRQGSPVRKGGLRFRAEGTYHDVDIEVTPLASAPAQQRYYLIVFEERPAAARPGPAEGPAAGPGPAQDQGADQGQLAVLEQELAATRAHLQSVIEQQEASNEDLRAANEEIVSSNEELRSTNEELQTAKEELQATNEELGTVNAELQHRNREATQLNNDMINLLSSVQIPIIMVGQDLAIRRFTPSAARILNLIPGDVGRPIGDIRPRINVPDLMAMIHEVLDSMVIKEREVRDQEGHWYHLCIRPYRTLDNRLEGAVLVVFDIDRIKQTDRALRASEARFEAFMSHTRALAFMKDEQGRYLYINHYFRSIFQHQGQDPVGKTDEEIFPPDMAAALRAHDDVVRSQGKPLEFQEVLLLPDGAPTSWLISRFPFEGADGHTLLGGVALDITARQQMEEALRASEARLRAIFDTAAEGVVTVDDQGRIQSYNQAAEKVFGFSEGEVRYQDVRVVVPAFFRPDPPGRQEALLVDMGREVVGRRKDGSEVPLHLSVSEVRGKPRLFVGVIRDLTEEKQARERSLQGERLAAIGQISAGLAHESRNALQRSQACLEMLGREVKDRPRALDLVARIQAAQDQLLTLYEEVRSYAAPIKLDRRPVLLDALLGEAWGQLQASWEQRDVELRVEPAALDLHCQADPQRLIQVLVNILQNALQACSDPVRIRVSWGEAELGGRPALEMRLANNGPPFSEEERARAFEAFFTTKPHGTGLGMTIANRIMEAHGGRMELGPERTAEVVITLPRGSS